MVFEAVQPLVVSVLDGYNVCIFAYGQTGSGKTFTMEGYGSDIGVSPRAISELFDRIASVSDNWEYSVEFSTLEIYNESIRDLLDSSGKKDKLDVRQGPEGNQVVGLTEVSVSNPEQVHELMAQGQSNRAVGSHDMNEHSSRRDRLKEAQNINRSLSALGDVINSLGSKKATHVPYRNSKLTFLLQDSLGGNSKVLMFVNISPAVYNAGESVCSLNFASRCRNVELGQARKQSDRKALMPPPT
ncbi:KIN14E, partial [Symbiodinium microadriaticum]